LYTSDCIAAHLANSSHHSTKQQQKELYAMEGPACTGCQLIIEEGSVIAFGDSLFHLKW